jgi:hypothetical protein
MSRDADKKTSVLCSVAPMLSVRNGARAVEFYKSAFGAIEVYRIEDPGVQWCLGCPLMVGSFG